MKSVQTTLFRCNRGRALFLTQNRTKHALTILKRFESTTPPTSPIDNDHDASSSQTESPLELNDDDAILSEITQFTDYQLSQAHGVTARGSLRAMNISEAEQMELANADAGLVDASQYLQPHGWYVNKLYNCEISVNFCNFFLFVCSKGTIYVYF